MSYIRETLNYNVYQIPFVECDRKSSTLICNAGARPAQPAGAVRRHAHERLYRRRVGAQRGCGGGRQRSGPQPVRRTVLAAGALAGPATG